MYSTQRDFRDRAITEAVSQLWTCKVLYGRLLPVSESLKSVLSNTQCSTVTFQENPALPVQWGPGLVLQGQVDERMIQDSCI